MKWLRGLIRCSFLVLLLLYPVYSMGNQNEPDPKSAAREVHTQFKDRAGSEKLLKDNFMHPLIGGGQLYTIDRSQAGEVKLACPGSQEFLTVLLKPRGTGDFDADVFWDSDMNGRLDKSYTVYNVSGVCANGYISCEPGTWKNCIPYTFEYSDGTLKTKVVGLTSLAGCFCINNFCGNNLIWTNVGYVLKVFGGAVAGAFQTADPRYAVSDVRADGTAIYYYGQKARDCEAPQGGTGSLNPEGFWKSPYTIDSALSNLVTAQSQDPNSYYSMMYESFRQSQGAVDRKVCLKKRNLSENRVLVSDIVEPIGGNEGQVRSCGDKCVQIVLGREGDNYWCASCRIYETYYDVLVKKPNLINKATIVRVKWDDWIQIWFNDILVWNGPYGNWVDPNAGPPGRCELSTSWDWGINLDVTDYFTRYTNPHILRTKNRVAVSGCGEGFSVINLDLKATCEVVQSIQNSCDQYENDSKCKLWEETIDGVQTVRQGIKTGLTPLRQPVNICDGVHTFDWMQINRVYVCENQGFDLSAAKQRLSVVEPSIQYSSNKITFTDTRMENNQWKTYPNQEFIVNEEPPGEYCEKACKVKANRPNVGVGTSNVVTAYQTGNVNYVYYYRTCRDNVCPVEPGETIETPCSCTNDFTAASTILQTLRLAGQDITCTTGQNKPMPGY